MKGDVEMRNMEASAPYQLMGEDEGASVNNSTKEPPVSARQPSMPKSKPPPLSTALAKGSVLWKELRRHPDGVEWAEARTGFTAAYIVSGLLQKKMFSYGACCQCHIAYHKLIDVVDAVDLTIPTPMQLRIRWIYMSWYHEAFMCFIVAVHVSTIFIVNYDKRACIEYGNGNVFGISGLLIGLEVGCIFFYVLELTSVAWAHQGTSPTFSVEHLLKYFRKNRIPMIVEDELMARGSDLSGERIVYALLIAVFALDAIVFSVEAQLDSCDCVATSECLVSAKVRPCWLFRWLLIPMRFNALFQLARSVWSAAPKLMLTTFCMLLIIGLFAISFFVLFSNQTTLESWGLTNDIAHEDDDRYVTDSEFKNGLGDNRFNSFQSSLLALFTVATGDNFPNVRPL
jgi:hypothetical protein